jgi:hypothetical protein
MPVFDVSDSIGALGDMRIVKQQHNQNDRFVLRLNLNLEEWQNLRTMPSALVRPAAGVADTPNVLSLFPHAIHFPHGSGPELVPNAFVAPEQEVNKLGSAGKAKLEVVSGISVPDSDAPGTDPLLRDGGRSQILEAYLTFHPGRDPEREASFLDALLESHPQEQVSRMVAVFGARIKSLGFLVGAWTHYAQKLEQELDDGMSVDLEDHRRQNDALDLQLRKAARKAFGLAGQEEWNLSAGERVLLHVLEEHDHPRRQLYWALKVRRRYPMLQKFLDEAAPLAQPPRSTKGSQGGGT